MDAAAKAEQRSEDAGGEPADEHQQAPDIHVVTFMTPCVPGRRLTRQPPRSEAEPSDAIRPRITGEVLRCVRQQGHVAARLRATRQLALVAGAGAGLAPARSWPAPKGSGGGG